MQWYIYEKLQIGSNLGFTAVVHDTKEKVASAHDMLWLFLAWRHISAAIREQIV